METLLIQNTLNSNKLKGHNGRHSYNNLRNANCYVCNFNNNQLKIKILRFFLAL